MAVDEVDVTRWPHVPRTEADVRVRRSVGIVDKVVVVDDVAGRGHTPCIEVDVRDRRASTRRNCIHPKKYKQMLQRVQLSLKLIRQLMNAQCPESRRNCRHIHLRQSH